VVTETPPPIPTPPPVYLPVNDDGVVQEDVAYDAGDDTLSAHIASGTVAKDATGKALETITVDLVCFGYPPPPANAYVIGCAYDFGPEGATFDPPITITLKYDPGLIPAGIAETDLCIAYYDQSKGKWVKLVSTVDTVNKVITAEVSGFTMFAVYAEAPAPTETPTPPPTATPTPTPEPEAGTNIGVIIGPIIAVIIIGIVAYLLLRRRGAGS